MWWHGDAPHAPHRFKHRSSGPPPFSYADPPHGLDGAGNEWNNDYTPSLWVDYSSGAGSSGGPADGDDQGPLVQVPPSRVEVPPAEDPPAEMEMTEAARKDAE